MESVFTDINTGSRISSRQWTIELSDLGTHQVYMGFSLSEKYMLIGITSPNLENQISINTISDNPNDEIVIPIELEKCDACLAGELNFQSSGQLLNKWEINFHDNRFGEKFRVEQTTTIRIREPERNTRGEKLRLMGYVNGENKSSVFELRLKQKS